MYQFLGKEIFLPMKECFSSTPSNLSLSLLLCLFLPVLLESLVAVSLAIFIISYRERPRFPRYAENNRSPRYIFRAAMHPFFRDGARRHYFSRAFTKRLVHTAAFPIFETSSFQLLENLRGRGREELQRCVIKPSRNFY